MTTVQSGANPLNHFLITKVQKTDLPLGSFSGPVIMFAGGHGFGPAMFSTAQLMSSASVTINFKQEYGHVDYMFSNNHLHELEHPILTWLLQKPFK